MLHTWKYLILASALSAMAFGEVKAQAILQDGQVFNQVPLSQSVSKPKNTFGLPVTSGETKSEAQHLKIAQASAPVDEDAKIRPYLERIDALEDRVRRLEALLSATSQQQASISAPQASRNAPPPDYSDATATGPQPAYSGQPAGEAAAPPPGAIQNELDREEYKQLLLVREHAVTLRKGDIELSGGGFYLRDNNFTQKDVAFQGNASIRYGIARGTEIAAAFNGFWSHRDTLIFNDILEYDLSDFGSADFQINKAVIKEGVRRPGVVLGLTGTVPLGDSPYQSIQTQAGRVPTDPFIFDLRPGHYLVRGNAQFFKSFDPISYYWGVGVEYAFPETVAGVDIEPGMRYSYNAGLGFAVNETTALGVAVSGFHQDRLRVGNFDVTGFDQDPVSLRMSVSHVLGNNFHLVPGVTVGLTEESPDVMVGLEVRKVFSAAAK